MMLKKVLLILSIIIAFISILWIIIYCFVRENIPNVLPAPAASDGYIFDYVIVGAGTTGSVVASILTKHSNSTVLLLEAGGSFGFLSKVPLMTTFQQKGLNDWSFLSVQQKHSSKGLHNQQQCLPRGKGLGGSSQLNFMLHFDGDERDFERWARHYDLPEWSAKSFQPFLDASRAEPSEMFEIERGYSKITESFDLAESEFCHKPWRFRRTQYNIRNGVRWSVYQKYLKPMLGSRNLRIIHNAMAKKVILRKQGNHVESLVVGIKDEDSRETTFVVDVQKELILAAGAYQTPQILQVSGIANRNVLQALKIPVQRHLPRVGANLHDHMNLPLFVSIDVVGPTLNTNALFDVLQIFKYLMSGTGHLGNFGVLGHVDGINDTISVTFFGAGAIDEASLMSISNFKRDHFHALFPRYYNTTQEGFVVISTCVQPKSRGTVLAKNANIRKNPLIDPNYLSDKADVDCTIRAIRVAVEVVTSSAFAALKPRIRWPKIKDCSNFGPFERDFKTNHPSDRYLECVLRYVGLSSHHPGGSCSMGRSETNSVVDAQMRVHGVKGLRIVDASILPTPISGNPNSVLVAMAIRAAAMILKAHQVNQS